MKTLFLLSLLSLAAAPAFASGMQSTSGSAFGVCYQNEWLFCTQDIQNRSKQQAQEQAQMACEGSEQQVLVDSENTYCNPSFQPPAGNNVPTSVSCNTSLYFTCE